MRKIMRNVLPLFLALTVIVLLYAGLHWKLDTDPFGHSSYDSYTLQALAWREGKVSLGQDYPHLELAIYEDDWYVSFPPVPSLVQLPLTLIFGGETPDGLLVKLYVVSAFLLLYSYFRRDRKLRAVPSALWSLFFVFATDMISVSLDGGVWYQAQTLGFLLVVAAFVSMARKKPTLSCILYALAVGCRPYSVFFGFVLLAMYLANTKKLMPLLPGIVSGLVIAACFAAYNYIRFGNLLEFGHNYLPEFTRVENGQFSLAYVAKNARTFLFGLPVSLKNGSLVVERFGFSMFLCNPVLLFVWIWVALDAIKRRINARQLLCIGLMLVHLFCLLLHKSFGGFQFGARYTLELIPYCLAYLHFAKPRAPWRWENVLFSMAVLFNAAGAYLINR